MSLFTLQSKKSAPERAPTMLRALCFATMLVASALWSALARADVYELRTYTAAEGKLGVLESRFRDRIMGFFEKHGMKNIAYWHPQDEPLASNTLIYLLAHKDRAAASASWAAFRSDPEWKKFAEESKQDGEVVKNVQSVFMDVLPWSPSLSDPVRTGK
ncbi:MAG: NIPSNAP family protein [Candidatus Nitrotoga sp.]